MVEVLEFGVCAAHLIKLHNTVGFAAGRVGCWGCWDLGSTGLYGLGS